MISSVADLSVVIPVKNGAPEVRACIEGILSQTVTPREIIAIDSGSSDETLSILAGYPVVRVVEIPATEFDHGETRNLGARLAKETFVLFTVQDARAASRTWIEEMLRAARDPEVAGVCGAQVVPHESRTNPVEWFRPVSQPRITRVQFTSAESFDALSPAAKAQACGWDNVNAMYRREALLRIPFRRMTYGEDVRWACDALRAGLTLAYHPGARVYHFHYEDASYTFRRALAALHVRYHCFGQVPTEPRLPSVLLRAAYCLARESSLGWGTRARWLGYTYRNRRALERAVRTFRSALEEGDTALEALYERHCGTAPVPPKAEAR